VRHVLLTALLLSLSTGACRGTSLEADGGPDPGGPTASGGTDGGPACNSSSDCDDDEICAAPYDGNGAPGEFVCMSECIPADHDPLWCADDRACCSGLSCDMLGFCLDPDGTTSG
jgi:hypothetical protein